MNRFKTAFIAIALILISSVILYVTYLSLYGVNCSFYIINDYTDLKLYEPFRFNLEERSKISDNSEYNSIDVMVIINDKVLFEGGISKNVEELINFKKRLKFGKNNIQIFSRELNIYAELSTNIYFGQNFNIWVKSNAQYFKDGELLDLEKIRNQLSSGELDDYYLNEAEVVLYSGFFINKSNNIFLEEFYSD